MKPIWLGITLFSFVVLFASCSPNSKIALNHASATIPTDDKISGQDGIMAGARVIKYITPTVLYYQFTFTNTGTGNLGSVSDPLQIKIKPHKKLKAQLQQIFHRKAFDDPGISKGVTSVSILEPNQSAAYTLTYELGTDDPLAIANGRTPLPGPARVLRISMPLQRQ